LETSPSLASLPWITDLRESICVDDADALFWMAQRVWKLVVLRLLGHRYGNAHRTMRCTRATVMGFSKCMVYLADGRVNAGVRL
jgi:hypothetical protein